jgi:predicted RNA polymerase sigma factor
MDDPEAALGVVQKIDMPDFYTTHLYRSIVFVQLERIDEARAAAARALELHPEYEENVWIELDMWNVPTEFANTWVNSLRRAGMHISDRPETIQ